MFATVWSQTTSREVSRSLVTQSLQMEWKTTHKKIKAVEDFPIPTTQRTIRQFLGLTSSLRRYVKGFAQIATGSTKPRRTGISPTNGRRDDQWSVKMHLMP